MTYNNAFKHHKLGYASANAWVMFVIIMILTALVFKSSSAWVFYETEAGRSQEKEGRKLDYENVKGFKDCSFIISFRLVSDLFPVTIYYICCFLHLRQKQKQLRSHRNYFRQNGDSKNFADAWNSQPFWQIFPQFCSGYGRNDDRTGSVMLPCCVWICKI